MDIEEAKQILSNKLSEYRKLGYKQLQSKIDQRSDRFEVAGSSRVIYQIVIRVVWDDKQDQEVRVLGSIDDGEWRSNFPLGDDFIVAPDGGFVGE
jgi:hypothetical protein